MKKLILLFLTGILFLALVAQAGTEEESFYADIWKSMNENDKNYFMLGVMACCFTDVLLMTRYSASDAETPDSTLEYLTILTEYILFYKDEDNVDSIIGCIDGFYSDPENGQVNPAVLAFLAYLHLQGQDVLEELEWWRELAELGAEFPFKKY